MIKVDLWAVFGDWNESDWWIVEKTWDWIKKVDFAKEITDITEQINKLAARIRTLNNQEGKHTPELVVDDKLDILTFSVEQLIRVTGTKRAEWIDTYSYWS